MPGGTQENGQPEWDLGFPCEEFISEPLPSLLKGRLGPSGSGPVLGTS